MWLYATLFRECKNFSQKWPPDRLLSLERSQKSQNLLGTGAMNGPQFPFYSNIVMKILIGVYPYCFSSWIYKPLLTTS